MRGAKVRGARATFAVLALSALSAATLRAQALQSADELVAELRQFQPAIPGTTPGLPDPVEMHRREIYSRLWSLGDAAMPALNRGLASPDVQLRRNVALFLGAAGGGWYDAGRQPRLNLRPCLSALIVALADADDRVRGLAAQAVGSIGQDAAPAVPALIKMLSMPEEGSRNTACIGLRGIGPAARAALPALRKARNDSSRDVRQFAQLAIAAIEK